MTPDRPYQSEIERAGDPPVGADPMLRDSAGRSGYYHVPWARETMGADAYRFRTKDVDQDANQERPPQLSVAGVSPYDPANPAFTVADPLGSGGMGVVHAATQSFMNRDVAIKRSHDAQGQGKTFESVIDEGRRVGRLDHPSIPPVHLLGRDDSGHAILVMKRIDGQSLKDILLDPAHPRWSDVRGDRQIWALNTVVQIARAVEHAHSRNILHRDIKTENIMIGDFGQVYLIDWGISINLQNEAECMTTSRFIGTPCFAAPEMVNAGSRLAPTTDVYLLAAMTYEIVTGKLLHTGTSVRDILKNIQNNPRVPDESEIPGELLAILQRALQPVPGDRYNSVSDFREVLEQFLTERFLHEQIERAEHHHKTIRSWLSDKSIDMESAYSFMTMAHESLALLKNVERSGVRLPYVRQLLAENLTLQTRYAILNRQFGVAKSLIAKLAQELGSDHDQVTQLAHEFSQARSNKANLKAELNLQSRTVLMEKLVELQAKVETMNPDGDAE